ncbi:MAG: dolichol kinase [Bacteroidetes bacterium]|nr:dolichol kinase [Bacteroidota bacterium]MBU1422602.1 dolichol kinase [Bacteroidota bacterium]MBU2471515.1 dolichol kinase [Bacteroidota bacterium]
MFDKIPNIDHNYKIEFFRKGIHFCSLSIPVVYFFIDKATTLAILIPVTMLFLVSDLMRYYNKKAATLYYKYFGWLLRNHERDEKTKRLTGASNILISAIICVLIFPKIITVTAFAVLIISDSTAALIGRRFGQTKFFKKSLEGAVGFFISAVIVVLLTPKVQYHITEYFIGVAGVAVAAIVESTIISIDDNITVPISIGIVMWILYIIFLPTFDIFIYG